LRPLRLIFTARYAKFNRKVRKEFFLNYLSYGKSNDHPHPPPLADGNDIRHLVGRWHLRMAATRH
jgi:hypothetical protein